MPFVPTLMVGMLSSIMRMYSVSICRRRRSASLLVAERELLSEEATPASRAYASRPRGEAGGAGEQHSPPTAQYEGECTQACRNLLKHTLPYERSTGQAQPRPQGSEACCEPLHPQPQAFPAPL